MPNKRELILEAVSGVLALIAGVPPFENDLGGRVYSKQRGAGKADATECPYAEVVTSQRTADSPRVLDDRMYGAELKVELAGYVKGEDSGDDFDAAQRPALNSLRSDFIRAMAGLDSFVLPSYGEPLRRIVGPVTALLISEWTEPSIETSDGYLVLDYSIRYLFDELNP